MNHALTLLSKGFDGTCVFKCAQLPLEKNIQSCHKIIGTHRKSGIISSQLDFNEESPFIHHIPLAGQIGTVGPFHCLGPWLGCGKVEEKASVKKYVNEEKTDVILLQFTHLMRFTYRQRVVL